MKLGWSNNMVLNLDRYLGKVKNRVSRVGIELEGGWVTIPNGRNIVGDGSVFRHLTSAQKFEMVERRIALKGELPSEIMLPGHMSAWIKKYYPAYVNESCGLHVHMSFTNLQMYAALMVQEYPTTVVAYLTKWAQQEEFDPKHPIWSRLQGDNEYCQHKFWPHLQVKDNHKDYDHNRVGCRYTHIAYRHGTHKTIECRLLPMFDDAKQSVRAVRYVIDITNASLVVLRRKREEKIRESLRLGKEDSVEHDVEVVD